MLIAIEGLDGVGKTETAKEISRRLGFQFVDKPMKFLLEETDPSDMQTYRRVTAKVNALTDSLPRMLFYAIGSVILREKVKSNIVVDRYFLSNYVNNQGDLANEFMELLIRHAGAPDLTLVLYASAEVRRSRMVGRNPDDPDIHVVHTNDAQYDEMRSFLNRHKLPYEFINTDLMSMTMVFDIVERKILEVLDGRPRFAKPSIDDGEEGGDCSHRSGL